MNFSDMHLELKEICQKVIYTIFDNLKLEINKIKIMEEKAPSRSKKPSESDLDSENDPYDQYKFKKEK